MAELLVRASTASFSGIALVSLVLRVAKVAFMVAFVIVAAASAAPIAAVPSAVDPLEAVTVDVQPVAVEGVTEKPSTVMSAGTGTYTVPAPVAAGICVVTITMVLPLYG